MDAVPQISKKTSLKYFFIASITMLIISEAIAYLYRYQLNFFFVSTTMNITARKALSFFFFEINVYPYAFFTYWIFKKNNFKDLGKYFLYLVVLLDIIVFAIGLTRFFIDSEFVSYSYARIQELMTNPFYYMAFMVFALYLGNGNQNESESDAN